MISLRSMIVFSSFLFLFLLIINANILSNRLPAIEYRYSDKQSIYTPESDIRNLDQTLLTFPEWYLVYSPEDLATLSKHETIDKFPFYRSVWQYWDSYLTVTRYADQLGRSNVGYHIMLMVIGVSTTLEYVLRGVYENSLGKLTLYLAGRAEEDDYAAKVLEQYAQFINFYPWYEFNFWSSLTGLWHIPLFGENFIRKIERRYILTTEYLVKYLYAKLISALTQNTYGVAKLNTVAVIDKQPLKFNNIPKYKQIKQIESYFLVELPRYFPFKEYALNLARQNINFVEIAGNKSFIALSIIKSKENQNQFVFENSQILFRQEILINPESERLFVIVPINQLGKFLRDLANKSILIEHIYDY